MGKDYERAATPEEISKMKALVDQGMREGAFGMSTGLFYVPQSFSKTDEVIALANTNWPGTPIIACCAGDKSSARECAAEAKTLKTLGFRAVADNPAQLPALLRQIEDQAATDDFQVPKESRNMVNGDTLTALPRALRGERLRKSFALLAALHLASDQKEAGRVALASALMVPLALSFGVAGSVIAAWRPRIAVPALTFLVVAGYFITQLGPIFTSTTAGTGSINGARASTMIPCSHSATAGA